MAYSSSIQLRILIVDDHEDTAECLCMVFKAAGFECRVAHNGKSALEAVQVFIPDVVLMDLCLPGMDGFELAASLKTMPFKDDVVLIALSGLYLFDGKERCAKTGIDHLLLKPVPPERLVKLVREACLLRSSTSV